MQQIIIYLTEQARVHGLGIMLLLAAVFWFNNRVEKLELKYDACISASIQDLKADREKMLQLIENNTEALKRLPK